MKKVVTKISATLSLKVGLSVNRPIAVKIKKLYQIRAGILNTNLSDLNPGNLKLSNLFALNLVASGSFSIGHPLAL